MATPTPMKHAPSQQGRTPSQQGRTPSQLAAAATPPVSTPFSNPAHTAFSPRGPKSSPQQVKKSPANHGTLGAFNFDSPSTAAAMGALGIGPGFDIGLDNVAGLEGLSALTGEDDKLKRLEAILNILAEKRGLVSEAGLERLAQRIGLELLSEEQTTPGGRKTSTLAIAGSAMALDIVLDNNIVQSVSLSYHGSATSVSRHMDAAGRVLLQDLQLPPGQSPLTKSLSSFASNLERLAVLDKLSIVPGLDCHEALAGIYDSLERLHQWDLAKLRQEPSMAARSDAELTTTAMCARHGIPVMHARRKVGLALQYWKTSRLAPPPPPDSSKTAGDKVWSLLIGCAPIEGLGLPPVRVSENWIAKEVTKSDGFVLDWLEPDNVSLPQSEENKDAAMDMLQPDLSTTRVPRVMFTVSFDPPVVLPQNDWSRLYMCAAVNPPDAELGPTFDSLLFPVRPGERLEPSEPRVLRRCRRHVRVFSRDGGKPLFRHHDNTLLIYKPIYSQAVTEMPFSHPRQLIDMLPLLRQYALVSILLETSFGGQTADDEADVPTTTKRTTTTTKTQLLSFTDKPSVPVATTRLKVTLWIHASPHLQVMFPMSDATTADVTIRVVEGGLVEIMEENVLDTAAAGKGKRKEVTRQHLARALESFEDLNKWCEWIRTRLGGPE
ncbi:hypothetical protein L249_5048 [Ophiocordyceps polyrhachis-furcata BCC 54312]|uniref:Mediator of RNA polymerase II transcription subunit 1 n=1 Tax=Ophiocordyceps polyrhachis-furcata BCC 54312 TaxID=1330021 RepID=A0A367L3U3_9HYPO|nr:hypothetical protein L249_5048 [Ophiocordyceps polyrhachis-furcata BCC 54312]